MKSLLYIIICLCLISCKKEKEVKKENPIIVIHERYLYNYERDLKMIKIDVDNYGNALYDKKYSLETRVEVGHRWQIASEKYDRKQKSIDSLKVIILEIKQKDSLNNN
jgi:hypothetical protein